MVLSEEMYTKHNLSQTPEYKCWQQIKARCLNPDHRAYPNYGGRGIRIALEWEKDFAAFYAYVGPRPTPQHSLDRYPNNNGNYEPGNVRWATWDEQANNRRPYGSGARTPRRPSEGKITNYKHGMISRPEYKAWISMKDRCLNPTSSNYPGWGGRGVTIHPAWVDDFVAFFQYVGPRPTPKHSLDRYPNNDGNYEPGNVRWASKQQQSANRGTFVTGPAHGNHAHGGVGTPEYKTWGSIKTRCFNPKHDGYPRYGAIGITMCGRWSGSFEAFVEDLGKRPSQDHIVGRKDLDGSYTCGSCDECRSRGWIRNGQWTLKIDQNRHRRSIKLSLEKAALIRKRAAEVTFEEVAREFEIGVSLVGKIVRGDNWV